MSIQGTTPFEVAERRRQESLARLELAANTQKIINFINECDNQINYYIGLAAIGKQNSEELALAKQAREDKEAYESALEALVKLTAGVLEVEA